MPNTTSLVLGLAWGASPPLDLGESALLIVLAFAVINLSSAIGAQVNTLSDYELDSQDNRKRYLVEAIDGFGQKRLKWIIVVEFLFAFGVVSLLWLLTGKAALLVMWLFGILLGCAYSASPLRFKSKSWLALGVLVLVLCVLPVFFMYHLFAVGLEPVFLVALAGMALTVYGLIVPTEIRDYFGDKAMNVVTMAVRLGLEKVSLFGITLLSVGSVLFGLAFFLKATFELQPILNSILLILPVVVIFVLKKYATLYYLSKKYASAENPNLTEKDIVALAAHNPQWIMLVTQTYSMLSIILLISNFLL
ncbi:MAG: UbiA family prenyltransferase [Candidatus Bathyarchaeia archaeon]